MTPEEEAINAQEEAAFKAKYAHPSSGTSAPDMTGPFANMMLGKNPNDNGVPAYNKSIIERLLAPHLPLPPELQPSTYLAPAGAAVRDAGNSVFDRPLSDVPLIPVPNAGIDPSTGKRGVSLDFSPISRWIKPSSAALDKVAANAGGAVDPVHASDIPGGVVDLMNKVASPVQAAGGAVTELGAQMVEQAPDMAVLGAAGRLARLAGVWPGLKAAIMGADVDAPASAGWMTSGKVIPKVGEVIGDAIGKVPGVTYLREKAVPLGGILNKVPFEEYQKRIGVAAPMTAEGIVHDLATGGTGKVLPAGEQRLLGMAIEHPEVREMLRTMNQADFPANRAALIEEANRMPPLPNVEPPSVGGMLDRIIEDPGANTVPGMRGVLKKTLAETGAPKVTGDGLIHDYPVDFLPEQVSMKPETFANIADKISRQTQVPFARVAKAFEQDPSALSRFYENDNYSPWMYTQKRIGAWVNRVTRSISGSTGGWLKARDSTTFAEQVEKGRIFEPAGPTAIRYLQQERTAAALDLFDSVAQTPGVVRPVSPVESMLPAKTLTQDGFIKMPVDKALGSLSGQMVRRQEANEVLAVNSSSSSGGRMWRQLFGSWRFGKTVLNPATHVNNMLSNIMQSHLVGLSPYDLKTYGEAASSMGNAASPYWKELVAARAEWTAGNSASSRLAADVMDIGKASRAGATNALEAFTEGFHRFVTSNPASEQLAKLYSGSEAYFKTAVYISSRKSGMTVSEAIANAEKGLFDYSKVPQWVRFTRGNVVPFITYTYKVMPMLAQGIVEHPEVMQHWRLWARSWNAVSSHAINLTPQERDDIMAHFPDGIAVISPFRTASGSPIVYNVARKTPMQDLLPGGMFNGGVPGAGSVAAGLITKNPVIGELAAQGTGRDLGTGASFAPPADQTNAFNVAAQSLGMGQNPDIQGAIQTAGYGENKDRIMHLLRTFMPEIAGGGATQNIVGAIAGGQPDIFGDVRSVPRAVTEAVVGKGRSLEQAKLGHEMTLSQLPAATLKGAKKRERGK